MYFNAPTAPLIIVSRGELECIDDFTYLGSLLSSNNGAHKDIKMQLNKARGAPINTFWISWGKTGFDGMNNTWKPPLQKTALTRMKHQRHNCYKLLENLKTNRRSNVLHEHVLMSLATDLKKLVNFGKLPFNFISLTI